MTLTEAELNPAVDLHLADAGARGEGTIIRWITRQLYIDIQCLAIAAGFQQKINKAIENGDRAHKTEALFTSLLATGEELEDRVQWLQNYKGRALLTCTHCLTHDVDAVLEIKEPDGRRRFCTRCYAKMNLQQLYSHIPGSPRTLPLNVKSLPVVKTTTGRMHSDRPNRSNGPAWVAFCDRCGQMFDGNKRNDCPRCGAPA